MLNRKENPNFRHTFPLGRDDKLFSKCNSNFHIVHAFLHLLLGFYFLHSTFLPSLSLSVVGQELFYFTVYLGVHCSYLTVKYKSFWIEKIYF